MVLWLVKVADATVIKRISAVKKCRQDAEIQDNLYMLSFLFSMYLSKTSFAETTSSMAIPGKIHKTRQPLSIPVCIVSLQVTILRNCCSLLRCSLNCHHHIHFDDNLLKILRILYSTIKQVPVGVPIFHDHRIADRIAELAFINGIHDFTRLKTALFAQLAGLPASRSLAAIPIEAQKELVTSTP